VLQILRGEQSSPNLCVILNTFVEVIKLLGLGSISLMLYKVQLPTYILQRVHADAYGKASLQYEVTRLLNVDGIPSCAQKVFYCNFRVSLIGMSMVLNLYLD
jgi:hypothetical protein